MSAFSWSQQALAEGWWPSDVRCEYCGQPVGGACIGVSGSWFARNPHKVRIEAARAAARREPQP